MNIVDFLIDNYIWILVIILVTIVTIIGFLADKKKSGNNNQPTTPQANPNMVNGQGVANNVMQYQQPLQNQPIQMNNMGMNYNNGMNMAATANQVPLQNGGIINNQPMDNINNQNIMMTEPQPVQVGPVIPEVVNSNPQPVENITPNTNPEPMYQPLSEQKPVIPPHPVPGIQAPAMINNQELSQSNFNVIDNNQNISNQNNIPNMMPNSGMQQNIMMPPNMNQMPPYNNSASMPQPMENNNNVIGPNYNQNNTTIPQPVSPIPIPQPVNPQPIMNTSYNQPSMMPQSYPQPMPNNNQVAQGNQPPLTTSPKQPVNFVFGPQNNNPNM